MGVWYTTRETVKAALESPVTARNDAQVDRAIEAASRDVEAATNRVFYPTVATRYFDWPTNAGVSRYDFTFTPEDFRATPVYGPYRLWLGQHEAISVTSLVSGGVTIPPADYFLEPNASGPPYDRIDLDMDSTSAYGNGNTWQREIAVTGVFGYDNVTTPAGTLAAAISTTTGTSITVSDGSKVGVGSVLTVDSEKFLVTNRTWVTTSQTLQSALTASNSDVTVNVTTGSAYTAGEVLLLDSEKMLIVDIAGNALTVKRAWDGSVLATHTGSTIYAQRALTVTRGALGTTAATHLISAAVSAQEFPGAVVGYTVAYALNQIAQETSGYARTIGSGDNARNASGAGIAGARAALIDSVGRRARHWAV